MLPAGWQKLLVEQMSTAKRPGTFGSNKDAAETGAGGCASLIPIESILTTTHTDNAMLQVLLILKPPFRASSLLDC